LKLQACKTSTIINADGTTQMNFLCVSYPIVTYVHGT